MTRHRPPRQYEPPHRATLVGGAVGMLSGGTFALALGAGAPLAAFGAGLGLVTGLVAGLLVWISSADLPEERIPPVRRDR